jgi:hypothetical protein
VRAVSVTKKEYRAWLQTLRKAQLIELVIETRAVADFLRGQMRSMEEVAERIFEDERPVLVKRASEGGRMRAIRSPKFDAKMRARSMFYEWQAGKTRHKSSAAFARHVIAKLPIIENPKTVERWVTQWREDDKARKQASS